jgi:glycine C-acetyltransferase
LAYLDVELDDLKERGLYRPLRVLEARQEAETTFDGKCVINLSSNNSLGLTTHPKLIAAAHEAIDQFGAGSGSVRTIAGTMSQHMELEAKIAAFKHTEAALVFQSGFTANAGTVSSVLGKEDVIISDELNHASIIDGCRLSRAKIAVFKHKDVADLRRVLDETQGQYRRTLVITDGVFSMDGDVAPLADIVEVAERYQAIIMVDDAHASGVMGHQGRGTVDHFGLHGRVHIQVGTLSKAIGCLGGYVAGSRALIDYLIHKARPFLFSTSHPPAVTAAALAAFDLLQEDPTLMEQLWENTRYFKSGLEALGFDTAGSETPITPVIAGDAKLAMELSDRLFAQGIFAQGIGFPTVPNEKSRVRTIVTATHTREELDRALAAFEKVGRELGLIAPSGAGVAR